MVIDIQGYVFSTEHVGCVLPVTMDDMALGAVLKVIVGGQVVAIRYSRERGSDPRAQAARDRETLINALEYGEAQPEFQRAI